MKRIMLVAATLMVVMLMFSMVGCHAVPRTPHFHSVKYELKEEISVKEDFATNKPPSATASINFGQSW